MIYILEDDNSIRELVVYSLKNSGMDAMGFERPSDLWKQMEKEKPSVLLLDIMLPEEDGLAILQRLRSRPETHRLPIIMLTAKSSEYDKVKGLDAGADDYLTKPFSGRELLARLRVMLRRNRPDREPSVFRLGPIVVDLSSRRVEKGKEEIHLTSKEYGILRLLLLHQGKVMTHRQLLREIWGPQHEEDTHYLRVHIAHLRQKLGDSDPENRIIRAESGLGYRIVADGAE